MDEKYIFRPHRGSLIDSLKEAIVFESLETLKEHVKKGYRCKNVEDVVLESCGDDDRIGWKNVSYVCIKLAPLPEMGHDKPHNLKKGKVSWT